MIIQTAVRRPVAILMLFAGLVLIGVQAYNRLSVDLLRRSQLTPTKRRFRIFGRPQEWKECFSRAFVRRIATERL